jgi:hypothetical protein
VLQLSDTVSAMTPKVIGLACDVRFTSEIKAGIVENALQFEESINVSLRPNFPVSC